MSPLVSPADLNTYLRTTLDPEVGSLAVSLASGVVRAFCRWQLNAEAVTFVVDGSGTPVLSLPTLLLTQVDEVRIDGTVVTDYAWSARGQLYRRAGWPHRFRCIEVECVHGYEVIPEVVRAVVFTLAVRVANNPGGLRSRTVGGTSEGYIFETMRGDLSELQMVQLGGFRLP